MVVTLPSVVACMEIDNDREYSRVHSDSGISGRPYDAIRSELFKLAETNPTIAKTFSYGTTLGGREMTMIRIAKDSSAKNRPGVLIAGTIHGDEFLNIEDRLPAWFIQNHDKGGVATYLNAGGIIWIAPILNPDGYEKRQRENLRNQDLNRDFDVKIAKKQNAFSQNETKGLYAILKQELASQNASLKLTMDYHCCVGALIYPWGHSETSQLPPAEKAEHLRLAKKIQEQFPTYRAGRAYEIVNYTAVGAADDFYHETFGSTSFTFEGAVNVENRNFDKHTRMWDELLSDQAAKMSTSPVTPQADQRPTIAVMASDASGLTLAAAAGVGTASMTLCKGNASACSSGLSVALTFGSAQQVGQRLIFKTSQTVNFISQELVTLQARDTAGAVLHSAVFKLIAN